MFVVLCAVLYVSLCLFKDKYGCCVILCVGSYLLCCLTTSMMLCCIVSLCVVVLSVVCLGLFVFVRKHMCVCCVLSLLCVLFIEIGVCRDCIVCSCLIYGLILCVLHVCVFEGEV